MYLFAMEVELLGAGTILDALKAQKPVISVVNESLKDNHQVEIVSALVNHNYVQGFLRLADLNADSV